MFVAFGDKKPGTRNRTVSYTFQMNPRPPEIPPHKLISALRGYDLLPAIIFMPTRRKCDEAASEVAGDRSQKTDPERLARERKGHYTFARCKPPGPVRPASGRAAESGRALRLLPSSIG